MSASIADMEKQCYVFLGIKVKPGPVERVKLENFGLDNTVSNLKAEAEKKTSLSSSLLELIHHGKILKDQLTLQECGIKNGEMVHVVQKREPRSPSPTPTYSDTELQELTMALRGLGSTPNTPGWIRVMELINDESVMSEIMDFAPSIAEDCVTLSVLHEVELLAAMGTNLQSMRRGANALPQLPIALRQLVNILRSRLHFPDPANITPPVGYSSYSLEALSDEDDADEEETEDTERNFITQEYLAAAVQAATDAVSSNRPSDRLLDLIRSARDRTSSSATDPTTPSSGETSHPVITPEMFSQAITAAMSQNSSGQPLTPMEETSDDAGSSSRTNTGGEFSTQLQHMHEMGLLDDSLNVRALLICSGDVNAAINLVFSGAIEDE